MTRTMAAATSAAAHAGGTMKALVQEGSGSADVLHLRDVEKPAATAGRVLIRVRAASVNALDWHGVHGGLMMRIAATVMRAKDVPIRGVDVAGIVEAVGDGVTSFAPGDEVFGSAPRAFAEYASAREDQVVTKPPHISCEQAAAVSVAARTALNGLRDAGELKPGQRVLVHGAGGGVGTFAVQIAKALGAQVTAVTGPRNVDVVRSLGPDLIIDYSKEDFARRPERYELVFDVAATRSLSDLRRVLTPGGILVLAGADKRGGMAVFTRIGSALIRSRVLKQRVRSFMAQSRHEDVLTLKRWIEEGKVRPAIDRTYRLSEARKAVRYVGTGQARAKVVITMG